jgi:hypothetical protein
MGVARTSYLSFNDRPIAVSATLVRVGHPSPTPRSWSLAEAGLAFLTRPWSLCIWRPVPPRLEDDPRALNAPCRRPARKKAIGRQDIKGLVSAE